MSFNAFIGGIEPGGLTDDLEVKILICFLLKKMEQPLTFDQINEVLQQTGFVNYFEFVEAISDLQHTEHIASSTNEDGEETFALTEIGAAMAQTFHNTLPLTVREKTVETAWQLIHRKKQMQDIEVGYHAIADGYLLTMKMKDIGSDLMDLKLFIPTEDECIELRENIYKDPLLLYKTMLAVLFGNFEEGKQLLEEKLQ